MKVAASGVLCRMPPCDVLRAPVPGEEGGRGTYLGPRLVVC